MDHAVTYMDCYPLMSRHADDANGALREFFGETVPRRMYTDNAPELIRACKDLKYRHDKSTPCTGTRATAIANALYARWWKAPAALLERAGLPSCFWPFAVRYWCLDAQHPVR